MYIYTFIVYKNKEKKEKKRKNKKKEKRKLCDERDTCNLSDVHTTYAYTAHQTHNKSSVF